MSEDTPQPAMRPPPARRRGGSGGVIIATCAAAALAAGSVLATALLLEEPSASARILSLFEAEPIHSIADANLPRVRAMAPQEVATLAGVDRAATGSIDAARIAPRLFGASVAKGSSLAALRRSWRAIEPHLPAPGLRPLAMIRDVGSGHELALVVGPFADAADAATLCPRLSDAPSDCGPVPFLGQALAEPE